MMKPEEVPIQEVTVFTVEGVHSFDNAHNVSIDGGCLGVQLSVKDDDARMDMYLFPVSTIEYVEMKGVKK